MTAEVDCHTGGGLGCALTGWESAEAHVALRVWICSQS